MANYDITAKSTPLEFDTNSATENQTLRWSDTRIIQAWNGGASVQGYVQAFDVNAGTGAVTAIGSPLSIDGTTNNMGKCALVAFDSTHFVLVYRDTTDVRVEARAFAVDGSGVITAAGTVLVMTDITNIPSAVLIDATHILVTGSGSGNDGYAKVITVNTGTWAITEAAAGAVEFDTSNYGSSGGGTQLAKIDSTHVLVAYGESGLQTQVLAIDGSFAVTSVAQTTITGADNPCTAVTVTQLDANHFMLVFDGTSSDPKAQVVAVNLSTWAITEVGTGSVFYTGDFQDSDLCKLNATNAVCVWTDIGNAFMVVLTFDASWNITPNTTLTFNTSGVATESSIALMNATTPRLVSGIAGADGDGFLQAFDVTMPPVTAIKTVLGLANASVKTILGLARASVKSFDGLQ